MKTVANIVLNAPFIKIDPTKANATRVNDGNRTQGTKIQSKKSEGSGEDEEDSSSATSSSKSDHSKSSSSGSNNKAASPVAGTNKGTRALPKRRCKGKPLPREATNDNTATSATASKKKHKAKGKPKASGVSNL